MPLPSIPPSIDEHLKSISDPNEPAGAAIRRLAMTVWEERDTLVRWPRSCEWTKRPLLRQARSGKVKYPSEVRDLCKLHKVRLDTLENGPATTAFRLAGGEIPSSWQVHHIYDGEHPILGWGPVCKACKSEEFFSHAGGLIAVPKAIHDLTSADPWLAWKLRQEAWNRFDFDPDGVFSHWQSMGRASSA